jgi:hypothetical protein
MKRRNRSVTPGGTITFNVLDVRGLVASTYIGTDDAGATETDPTGGGALGNNMVIGAESSESPFRIWHSSFWEKWHY